MPEKDDIKSGAQQLSKIAELKYEDFVKALGDMAGDSKLQAAIKAGNKDGKMSDERVRFVKKDLQVNRLRPTQNEIDVDKSLAFPLENKFPKTTKDILESGRESENGVEILAPIVVLNNQYIIDGHHRWSQIFAMNSKAKVSALVMVMDEDPIDVLKAVQLAIAAKTGEVETQSVEGENLLTIKEDALKDYVKKNISDGLVAMMSEMDLASDKEAAADYIWNNVRVMQRRSQPIKGAPDRDVMPQTDTAEGGPDDWKKLLQNGVVNFKEPLVKNERRIHTFTAFINENEQKDAKEALEFAIRHGLTQAMAFKPASEYKEGDDHRALFSLFHYESGWPVAGLKPDYFGDEVPAEKFKGVVKSAKDYLKTGVASDPIVHFVSYLYTDAAPGGRSQGPIESAIKRIQPEFNEKNRTNLFVVTALNHIIKVLSSWSTGTPASRLNLAVAVKAKTRYTSYAGSDFEKVYGMIVGTLRKNKIKLKPDSKIEVDVNNSNVDSRTIYNSIGFSQIDIKKWESAVTYKVDGVEYIAGSFKNSSGYGYGGW